MRAARLPLLAALFGCVATGLSHPLAAAEQPVSVTLEASVPAGLNTPQVTAVGLRSAPATSPAAPLECVVLIDTSASQTGVYRVQTIEAVRSLMAAARPLDRFALAAIDVASTPLTEGFHAATEAPIQAAIRRLDDRPPLGSTELVAALEDALARFVGDAPKAIIYIGDGPALSGVDPGEFARIVAMLKSSRVVVSSLGIGSNVNWQCLGALANHTGGMLVIPTAADDINVAARRVGELAVAPVAWPLEVSFTNPAVAEAVRMLPTELPPLRADRDSIALFAGEFPGGTLTITLEQDGSRRSVSCEIPLPQPDASNAYLTELARNAFTTDGLFLPTVGEEGLMVSRTMIRGEAASLAALSMQAEATGSHSAALRLAEASLRRDPDNQEASLIHEAALRQFGTHEELPLPGMEPDTTAGLPGEGSDELVKLDAMRRVRSQALERDTAVRIREARELLTTDPDAARDELKQLQQIVETSPDLDAGTRARLKAQLEMRIRESIIRAREKLDCDLAAERRAAVGRERMRMTNELQRREEKIKQLTEKYAALVEEGIRVGYAQAEYYPDLIEGDVIVGEGTPTRKFIEAERGPAEEIAMEAPPLYANHPIPMTAREIGRTAPIVARILHYDTQNYRIRRDQQRGFMDALHLVDVAGIPFLDEPPIRYPSPERWAEITRLREKFKSVDLANPGSKEKAIYDALDKPVNRWEFEESPLRDVETAIEDEFNIPVEIDNRALEELGLDPDLPVTQKASGSSLRAALRRMLDPLDLAYLVKDEVLLITTKEKAQEEMVVKVYPVADLVLPVNAGSGVNPFAAGGGMGGNAMGGGMGGGMGGIGGGMGGMGMGGMGGMGMGGMCWVAREVYGVHNPRWLMFRTWITTEAPVWMRNFYAAHGEAVAVWLRDKPAARIAVRLIMDGVLASHSPAAEISLMQISAARKLSAATAATGVLPASATRDLEESSAAVRHGSGLPADVLSAADLRTALAAYIGPDSEGDAVAAAERMARLRVSAAQLGAAQNFERAADLLAAAISAGHGEPWMYESLAIAMEAAGRPRADVERALLSAADFASSSTDLLQLAQYLARFGFDSQAIRTCRSVVRADPANREAFALAMTVAARGDDIETLRWACPGVLLHEWPAAQQDVATRAGRLAKATIDRLRSAGRTDDATAFQADVDAALVRDIMIDLSWTGDADIDVAVREPTGTVCALSSPRSSSGGTLLADGAAGGDGTTHHERYVAPAAFSGEYQILVRRSWGKVAADTVTAEMTIHKGTDREQTQKRQIRLGADEHLLTVSLADGRRFEPLPDAEIAQDIVAERTIGRAMLAQQLAQIVDPAAIESMSASRSRAPQQPQQGGGGLPFFGRGTVGYQPVISTLPEGTNLVATAVI